MAYPDCFEPTRGSNVRKTPDEEGRRSLPASIGSASHTLTARRADRRTISDDVCRRLPRHEVTILATPSLHIDRSVVAGECRLGPVFDLNRAGSEIFYHVFMVFSHYFHRHLLLLRPAWTRHTKECKAAGGRHSQRKSRSRS